jgi:hypothetical protein
MPGCGGLQFDAFKVSVKGKIEIEACLLAVRDNVESGGGLIVQRGDDRIVLRFRLIRRTEVPQMLTSKFKPSRKRVTANDRSAKRTGFHVIELCYFIVLLVGVTEFIS